MPHNSGNFEKEYLYIIQCLILANLQFNINVICCLDRNTELATLKLEPLKILKFSLRFYNILPVTVNDKLLFSVVYSFACVKILTESQTWLLLNLKDIPSSAFMRVKNSKFFGSRFICSQRMSAWDNTPCNDSKCLVHRF